MEDSETLQSYCPDTLSLSDPIDRWHLIMFLDEFVLKADSFACMLSLTGFDIPLSGTDYLTRSGQELFKRLEKIDEEKKKRMTQGKLVEPGHVKDPY